MSRAATHALRAEPINSGRPPRGAGRDRLTAFGVAAGLHLVLFAAVGLSLGHLAPPPVTEEPVLVLDLTPTRPPIPQMDRQRPAPTPVRPDEPLPIKPRETAAPVPPDAVSPFTPPRPEAPAAPAEPAPAPPERPAAPAAAQTAPARAAPDARASFQNEVLTRIERARRYPPAARARREQGTTQVAFTLGRDGRVLAAAVERSSGSAVLDREALATVRRAALPVVPADLPAPIKLSVAVEFYVD